MTSHSVEQNVYRINLRKLNMFLFLVLIMGAGAYFMTTNRLSTTGFVFKDLKQQVNELADENGRLEGEVSELASFRSINPKVSGLGLVASSDIAYVNWDAHIVARK